MEWSRSISSRPGIQVCVRRDEAPDADRVRVARRVVQRGPARLVLGISARQSARPGGDQRIGCSLNGVLIICIASVTSE